MVSGWRRTGGVMGLLFGHLIVIFRYLHILLHGCQFAELRLRLVTIWWQSPELAALSFLEVFLIRQMKRRSGWRFTELKITTRTVRPLMPRSKFVRRLAVIDGATSILAMFRPALRYQAIPMGFQVALPGFPEQEQAFLPRLVQFQVTSQ